MENPITGVGYSPLYTSRSAQNPPPYNVEFTFQMVSYTPGNQTKPSSLITIPTLDPMVSSEMIYVFENAGASALLGQINILVESSTGKIIAGVITPSGFTNYSWYPMPQSRYEALVRQAAWIGMSLPIIFLHSAPRQSHAISHFRFAM